MMQVDNTKKLSFEERIREADKALHKRELINKLDREGIVRRYGGGEGVVKIGKMRVLPGYGSGYTIINQKRYDKAMERFEEKYEC